MNFLNKIDITVYICLVLTLSIFTLVGSAFLSFILIIYITIYLHKKEKKEKYAK